jgi:hypothetical protein
LDVKANKACPKYSLMERILLIIGTMKIMFETFKTIRDLSWRIT